MQQHSADRIGAAAAVIHQFAKSLITLFHHILFKRREQIVKRLHRHLKRRNRLLLQALHHRVGHFAAACNRIQTRAQLRQALQTRGIVGIAFIGNIVGSTRISINRVYRLAQAARQNQRADREVFVMVNRHSESLKPVFHHNLPRNTVAVHGKAHIQQRLEGVFHHRGIAANHKTGIGGGKRQIKRGRKLAAFQ